MEKKEAKKQYLISQLNDPNTPEYEKKHIRQRLGIKTIITKENFSFIEKTELINFVYEYLEEQLLFIRKEKRTKDAFNYLTSNLKTIYQLSTYSASFDDDSLEQMYEVDGGEDLKNLSNAFQEINLFEESTLIDNLLSKKKIGKKEITKMQNHFWESDEVILKIETAIEKYIFENIEELINLQNL